MGNSKSHNRDSENDRPNSSTLSFPVDVASLFSNFPMRSTGNSVRSTLSNHSCGKANLSRSSRKGAENSGSDPFINSKTVWPVTFCEVPFLPEFPVRGSVDESDFDVICDISSGAYGKVSKVMKKDKGVIYAMKVMSKSKILMEDAVRQVKDEIRIQTLCGHHPFLIPGPFHWQNRRHLFIVMEYVDGGDLHQLWKDTGPFEEELIKLYIGELAITLDFLHNAGIIYRDLKMENVLIDSAGHIKLIDFGLSKWLAMGSKTNTLCGTLFYMAPEVLRQESYTHAIDWWSLGVLLYALLLGEFPFRGVSDCEDPSAFEWNDDSGARASAAARRLVTALLAREAGQRLRSVRQLERSAFFHHFDFDRLRAKQIDPAPLLQQQRRRRRGGANVDADADAFTSFDATT